MNTHTAADRQTHARIAPQTAAMESNMNYGMDMSEIYSERERVEEMLAGCLFGSHEGWEKHMETRGLKSHIPLLKTRGRVSGGEDVRVCTRHHPSVNTISASAWRAAFTIYARSTTATYVPTYLQYTPHTIEKAIKAYSALLSLFPNITVLLLIIQSAPKTQNEGYYSTSP